MDESQERIRFAGYLLETSGLGAQVEAMRAASTWEVGEGADLERSHLTLQWFKRPMFAARDDAPNTHPDAMTIWVAAGQ